MDRISENGQHFWYLAFAGKRTDPLRFVPEKHGIGVVEAVAPARPGRPINKDYGESPPGLPQREYRNRRLPVMVEITDPLLGREVDTYA